MGFFDFLKNSAPQAAPETITYPATLAAMAEGTFAPMDQIPDGVFSEGILGTCCGVDPAQGKVYAPISGKISQLADTLHAVGIESSGMDLLIHVGVDTVDMNGNGFKSMVKLGQTVKKGDLLLTMDLDKIRAAGHPTTVILAVTNSDDFASVEPIASGAVQCGSDLMRVSQ